MGDKRRVPRSRTFLVGKVVFNDRASVLDCLVRDLSKAGAKLEVPNAASVPELFELQIGTKGELYRSRVTWRTEKELGVTFVD